MPTGLCQSSWFHRHLFYKSNTVLLSPGPDPFLPSRECPLEPTALPTPRRTVPHLDVGIQGRMDTAGSKPDRQGSGIGERGRHHVAGSWEGEQLEAQLLVEVDELGRRRFFTFAQDATHCTAALLRWHLGRAGRAEWCQSWANVCGPPSWVCTQQARMELVTFLLQAVHGSPGSTLLLEVLPSLNAVTTVLESWLALSSPEAQGRAGCRGSLNYYYPQHSPSVPTKEAPVPPGVTLGLPTRRATSRPLDWPILSQPSPASS